MSKVLNKLFTDAVEAGFTLYIGYGEEADYIGTNVRDAIEAAEACDEIEAVLCNNSDYGNCTIFIVNDLDGMEALCDFSGGWMDAWFEENK